LEAGDSLRSRRPVEARGALRPGVSGNSAAPAAAREERPPERAVVVDVKIPSVYVEKNIFHFPLDGALGIAVSRQQVALQLGDHAPQVRLDEKSVANEKDVFPVGDRESVTLVGAQVKDGVGQARRAGKPLQAQGA